MGGLTHTFANGETIGVRPVNHYAAAALRKSMPPPEPPQQEVEGPDGKPAIVANPADPGYQHLLLAWEVAYVRASRTLMLQWGAEIELTDARRARIGQFRQAMAAAAPAAQLPEDDAELFLFYLCIGSEAEEELFYRVVQGLSQPTKEAVAQAAGQF